MRVRNVKVNASTFYAPGGATPPGTRGLSPGQACKKLRDEMGLDRFRAAYGKNRSGANAFGKCVSKMAHMRNDAARAAAVARIGDAADRCTERTASAKTKHGEDDHKGKTNGHGKGKGHGKSADRLASCLHRAV